MGLDLILFKKVKEYDDMSDEEMGINELAYGRKTWSISDFFTDRCECIDPDFEYIVTKDVWDEFIHKLSKLNDSSFRDEIETFLKDEVLDPHYKSENHIRAYNELEQWLGKALENDDSYTLGLEWELETLLRWFDANDKVLKTFEEGIDVALITSY